MEYLLKCKDLRIIVAFFVLKPHLKKAIPNDWHPWTECILVQESYKPKGHVLC